MVATRNEMVVPGSDDLLVARLKSGDMSAFNELVHLYREKMLMWLTHHTALSYADAEEIANDAFVRVFRGIGGFRGDSSFSTWLFRITINLGKNRIGYLRRRRMHLMDSFDTPERDGSFTLAEVIPSEISDVADEIDIHQLDSDIATALRKLRPRQRQILTLLIIEHATYKQISDSLGIKVGTVKSRIARAREALREEIEKKRHTTH